MYYVLRTYPRQYSRLDADREPNKNMLEEFVKAMLETLEGVVTLNLTFDLSRDTT